MPVSKLIMQSNFLNFWCLVGSPYPMPNSPRHISYLLLMWGDKGEGFLIVFRFGILCEYLGLAKHSTGYNYYRSQEIYNLPQIRNCSFVIRVWSPLEDSPPEILLYKVWSVNLSSVSVSLQTLIYFATYMHLPLKIMMLVCLKSFYQSY